MKIHPIAEIFPRIFGADFVALKEDIRKNGLLEAIWTYQGEIIEGRNRYYACGETGVEPQFREYTGDDPLGFTISLNLTRRHLTDGQRQMVGAAIAKIEQEQKQDETTIGASQEKVSNLLNTSVHGIQRAKGILHEGTPELIEAVKSGKVSVSAASVVATLPKEEQQQIVAAGEVAKAAKKVRGEKSRKIKAIEITPGFAGDEKFVELSDVLIELASSRKEIDAIHLLVTGLTETNLVTEIEPLQNKVAQFSAKLDMQIAQLNVVVKHTLLNANLLGQIRNKLGVNTNNEILDAIK
ncbi:hypothetical protein [Sulfurirhabdus autotrophica]|uniref:Uncharacterized protein n=1 Tax=Sulfurirhabdus autotrophica TaxID=1706046 RepID=A0A4R3YGP4_9PROT|nr:hypothetical protein [Sulfurirhabdus autotrophica]TCV90114.1 hypothetical protein EDC63_10181 [Sulfurirhabdus autotrophica]